jgi:hypothetical protein
MTTNSSRHTKVRHEQATLNSAYRPEMPNRAEIRGTVGAEGTHFSPFTHCHFICVRCGCL